MLLTHMAADRPNLFEEMIKALMENRKRQVAAFIWVYDHDHCLLSDRGFSQPISDGAHMALSFNLCSTAFIDYVFADAAAIIQESASRELLAVWKQRPHVTINVTTARNNREMLARYNRRVIEQSFERVYCAAKEGLVLS
jgi:hypothetical protein